MKPNGFLRFSLFLWLVLATSFIVPTAFAQDAAPPPQEQPKADQQAPAQDGGPQTDVSPIAVPKKKDVPPPPKEPKLKNPPEIGNYTIHKDVPLVTLDVSATTKDGQFISNLKKENFRIYEDGVEQKVADFHLQQEKPITAVLLVEFSSINYSFMLDALRASYGFAATLKKEDWISVIAYDMRPHMLTDFTQNKEEVYDALGTMRVPGFREANLFDALYDTIDRLERVEGHKYVILVASGLDTFSKLRLDQIYKKVQTTKDITIYSVGTGQLRRNLADPYMGSIARLNLLQADNQMRTFAKYTGGKAYFPIFEANFKEVFADIGADIRNNYLLTYYPSNSKQDGSTRKLKVELGDGNGGPLHVLNQKGKEQKVELVYRDSYTAKNEVD
jgi:VWFA-related protein